MEGKTYTKVCERCGKTFTAKMKQTRFCHSCAGAQCAGRKKAHGEKREKHVKNNMERLTSTAIEAREHGMSYGQWMALTYKDRVKVYREE